MSRAWTEVLRPNLRACHTPAEASAYLWSVHEAAERLGLTALDREALRLRTEVMDATAERVGELVTGIGSARLGD